MVLGKSRQAHQRTAGSPANGRLTSERKAYLPLPIVTHQSLDPAARALKRQASCLLRGLTSEQSCTRTLDRQRTIMHSSTRQALNASTRSVYAKWYWVNHGRLTSERQAHQRMQSLPSATHRHSSRPCCSSAQAPSFFSPCAKSEKPSFFGSPCTPRPTSIFLHQHVHKGKRSKNLLVGTKTTPPKLTKEANF